METNGGPPSNHQNASSFRGWNNALIASITHTGDTQDINQFPLESPATTYKLQVHSVTPLDGLHILVSHTQRTTGADQSTARTHPQSHTQKTGCCYYSPVPPISRMSSKHQMMNRSCVSPRTTFGLSTAPPDHRSPNLELLWTTWLAI